MFQVANGRMRVLRKGSVVAQRTKHERILSQVENSILTRQLKPGDKLPPERELQEKYQIGRGTVREVLIALQQKGLIEIRKGAKGGAFVREVDNEYASETLALLIRHGRVSVKHLADFREVVEVTTAAHAAERATPEDIRHLKELLAKGQFLMRSNEDSYREFYQWELNMHRELARISRNPIFEWISGTLYISMEPLSFYINKVPTEHDEVFEDWQDIVESIEHREVLKLISIVKSHMLTYRRVMEKEAREIPVPSV